MKDGVAPRSNAMRNEDVLRAARDRRGKRVAALLSPAMRFIHAPS
jgi:hypothetical protein